MGQRSARAKYLQHLIKNIYLIMSKFDDLKLREIELLDDSQSKSNSYEYGPESSKGSSTGSFFGSIGSYFGSVGSAIGSYFGSVGSAVGSYFGSVGSAIGSYWGSVGSYWGSVIDGLGDECERDSDCPLGMKCEVRIGNNFPLDNKNICRYPSVKESACEGMPINTPCSFIDESGVRQEGHCRHHYPSGVFCSTLR